MSETITSDPLSAAPGKPVPARDDEIVKFPPYPEPTDDAFEDDISEEERTYYKNKYPDLNAIKNEKLHCSACDRHLGCSARNESRMRVHPMLRTLVCHTCHSFYNSGEFDKGDDGSELYCRWCGQGGQVYCCSDCPIVFCAKCIKRNFGMPKIKEIENTDDWKCFKCNPRCLWDLRAMCWALLRYCDLRNKTTYKTVDPELREAYQKACASDDSKCCKAKMNKKKEKEAKKKELDNIKPEFQRAAANKAASAINAINVMTKIPPTIQVKKFASINLDESPPKEKKAQKRPAEKDNKPGILRTPVPIGKGIQPISITPLPKKIRLPTINMPPLQLPTVRFHQQKPFQSYARIRPKPPQISQMSHAVLNNYINNNLNNMVNNYSNDNINLSLENLTQGLDMSAVAGLPGMSDSDVVCTPDFPLEPLCEVMEDNNDDDVECITPAGPAPPAPAPGPAHAASGPSPAAPRALPELCSDNIIQMTENDVTVNAATGGLKFRVDPQTLSSNKMYRLPDGRVFAINANPSMPGGYSATIVALTDNNMSKIVPKGSTYAAKLSAVAPPQTPSPTPSKRNRSTPTRVFSGKKTAHRRSVPTPASDPSTPRNCDLKIPVEWFRYNLIDSVDALEYSLSRLQKLKKEATTMHLRSRTVDEMRSLHKTLDSMLKTTSCRFNEIRENLNKEMKQYVKKKTAIVDNFSDDDDDVEILNDVTDDPIFIDENSLDSSNANETNGNLTNEVDLTGPASSDHNDSGEKSTEHEKDHSDHSNHSTNHATAAAAEDDDRTPADGDHSPSHGERNAPQDNTLNDSLDIDNKNINIIEMNGDIEQSDDKEQKKDTEVCQTEENTDESSQNKESIDESEVKASAVKNETENHEDDIEKDLGTDIKEFKNEDIDSNDGKGDDKDASANEVKIKDMDMSQDKLQDTEMTEALIDSLLKDDNTADGDSTTSLSCMDIPEDFPEP